jgi:putative oxidoreductase
MQQTLHTGELRPKRKAIAEFVLKNRNQVIEIISALYILLFAYTALSKLTEFSNFRNTLWRSPFLQKIATPVAWAIPITELVILLLLFIPKTRLWGLLSSLVLMTGFTLYIAYMLAFESNLPCSCGGVIQNMTWTQHLFFNTFFILLAFIGIKLSKQYSKIEERPTVVFT